MTKRNSFLFFLPAALCVYTSVRLRSHDEDNMTKVCTLNENEPLMKWHFAVAFSQDVKEIFLYIWEMYVEMKIS